MGEDTIGVLGSVVDALQDLWSPRTIIEVQRLVGPGWATAFLSITLLGDTWGVLVVLAVVRWLIGRRLAYGLLGLVLVVTLATDLLKVIVGLPRPHAPGIVIRDTVHSPSFPSGHSSTAAGLYGGLVVGWRLPSLVAAVIIGAVMFSRIYLGVHYLGDVLGGALLGLALLVVCARRRSAIYGWFARQSPSSFLVVAVAVPLAGLAASAFVPPVERDWQVLGGLFGVSLGVPLEYRYVAFDPAPRALAWQAVKLVIGFGVLGVLAVAAPLAGRVALPLEGATFALMALWVTLLAPLLFRRMGLARQPARPPAAVSGR